MTTGTRLPGKLGKRPAVHDPRTLRLQDYLTGLPVPPAAVTWDKLIASWGMMLNDQIGDCTCAAMGHATQSITANASKEVTVPDSAVLTAYEAVGGYVPGNPATDNGADMLNCCNYWQKTGVGGHTIAGFVSCPRSQQMVELAIDLFGGLYIGFEVPQSAMTQYSAGRPWTVVTPDGGIVGGHAIWLLDYDATYITCITWGQRQKLTWQFFTTYCDEAYAVVSHEWVAANGQTPSGLDWNALSSDLAQIGGAPAPTPVWVPDPQVVAGMTWEGQVTAYLPQAYASGDVADTAKYEIALAQYAQQLGAYLATGKGTLPSVPSLGVPV